MTGDFDDDLRRRLNGLSADLDGASLPGPTAARARAARRTRHQVTGGVLAGVAAVAAGVALISPSDLTTTPDPAPPASLSTPTTTDPATTTLVDDLGPALLAIDDAEAATGWELQLFERDDVGLCGDASALTGRASVQAGVSYQAPGDRTVRHDLARIAPDASTADIWAELRSCLPARGVGDAPVVTDEFALHGVGDEGRVLRYYADPGAEGSDAVTAALVRYRDVISLTLRTERREDTQGAGLDTALPMIAAERVCDTLFGETCVTDPVLEPLDQTTSTDGPVEGPTGAETADPTGDPADDPTEPSGDPTTELLDLAEDPFLTDDDVTRVGTATGFFRSPESAETTAHFAPCLQDPTAAGADTVAELGYIHDLDASLVEWVARMPDTRSAFQLVAAHTVLPDVCGEVTEDFEQTVGDPVALEVDGADDAIAWTVEGTPTADNAGAPTSFAGIGIAHTANIVVVVSFAAMDDPTDGDWPGVAAGLLATAVERAAG